MFAKAVQKANTCKKKGGGGYREHPQMLRGLKEAVYRIK
jgi:hypothetical protein